MVLGTAKALGVPIEYALDKISYINAIMYSSAMPMYGDGKKSKDAPLYDDSLDGCKMQMDEDEEIVTC